jgi:hypothetical protein
MKKQIYLTIIGIGALLAIIGFASPSIRAIWGILIAGITGAIYYFNTKNERKVQERLEGEQEVFGTEAPAEPVQDSDVMEDSAEPVEENPEDGPDEDSAE